MEAAVGRPVQLENLEKSTHHLSRVMAGPDGMSDGLGIANVQRTARGICRIDAAGHHPRRNGALPSILTERPIANEASCSIRASGRRRAVIARRSMFWSLSTGRKWLSGLRRLINRSSSPASLPVIRSRSRQRFSVSLKAIRGGRSSIGRAAWRKAARRFSARDWQRRIVAAKLPCTNEDRASVQAVNVADPPKIIVPPEPSEPSMSAR